MDKTTLDTLVVCYLTSIDYDEYFLDNESANFRHYQLQQLRDYYNQWLLPKTFGQFLLNLLDNHESR